MASTAIPPPLTGVPSRQAVASLAGYNYQMWRSVEAWLKLQAGEALYLECGEDFDKSTLHEAITTQVKSSPETITLASRDVRAAITSLWTLAERNSDRSVRMHFLTRGMVGSERNGQFDGETGIDVWRRAARESDEAARKLAAYLCTVEGFPTDLRDFLATASVADLRERLFSRLDWLTGQPGIEAVQQNVSILVIGLGSRDDISPSRSLDALHGLLAYCWDVAIRSDPDARVLTREQRDQVFERRTSILIRATEENLRGLFSGRFLSTPANDDADMTFSRRTEIAQAVEKSIGQTGREKAVKDLDFTGGESCRGGAFADVALSQALIDLCWAWAKCYGAVRQGRYLYKGHVKLCARHRVTGDLSNECIWGRAVLLAAEYEYTSEGDHRARVKITRTTTSTNPLDWLLDVSSQGQQCTAQSQLTLRGTSHPIPSTSDDFEVRDDFYAYFDLLKKLRAGWEPVGFLSLNAGESAFLEPLHPHMFVIEPDISDARMEMEYKRCTRISLGYEQAEKWKIGAGFLFTRDFFLPQIADQTFIDAFERLATRVASTSHFVGKVTEVLADLGDTHVLVLTLYGGYVRVDAKRRGR
ncbi:hypothetical protein [Cupriavidus pauculus]|uniref:hypothetical protein n=1 Tax=Cupriavidus pauculus TaxID=82633 RepID=UPI0012490892|nr:hypothetical protein [Cupriavidus pauculus]KAB0601029.1 hypothetical protein F7R19_18305 [Cupriavidus pauculus]UAL01959.1 hypothetical protein K8O84_24400 [Cupriavidus pauculus]